MTDGNASGGSAQLCKVTRLHYKKKKRVDSNNNTLNKQIIIFKMAKSILSFNCDKKYANKFHYIQLIANNNGDEYGQDIYAILLQETNSIDVGKDELIEKTIKTGRNKLDIFCDHKQLTTIINKSKCETLNVDSNKEFIIIGDDVTRALICKIRAENINEPIVLVNIYIKPPTPDVQSQDISSFMHNIQNKTKTLGWSKLIIMGDVNGIDPLWCPPHMIINYQNHRENEHTKSYLNRIITRGRIITDTLQKKMHLECLNDISAGPTRVNREGTVSYLNICFVGEKTKRKWKCLDILDPPNNPKFSSHKVLALKQNQPIKAQQTDTKDHNNSDNLELTYDDGSDAEAEWKWEYERNCERGQKRSGSEVEAANSEHKRKIPLRVIKRIKRQDMRMLDEQLNRITIDEEWIKWQDMNKIVNYMEALSEILYAYLGETQASIESEKYKPRNGNSLRPKSNYNTAQIKLAKKLRKLKRNSKKYDRHRSKIMAFAQLYSKRMSKSNEDREVDDIEHKWNEIHAIESLVEIDTTKLNRTNEIDTYLETLDTIAEEKFPNLSDRRAKLNDELTNCMADRQAIPPKLISENEINLAIYMMRKKRHTGVDGIKFKTLFDTITRVDKAKRIVTAIVQMSRFTCEIPMICRTNLGKIIPKKVPGKFRIVHLSTPLSSLIEQTILHELEFALEHHNRVDSRQFGFTKRRGRHDLVTKVLADTLYNKLVKQTGASTTLISLDVKGAFDNVIQAKLVKKLFENLCNTHDTEYNYTMMSKWLANFLLSKQVILDYKGKRTSPRQIYQGVPQGSCLGPILWNFMIESVTTQINSRNNPIQYEILSYADDIMLCIRNITMRTRDTLQTKTDEFVRELALLDLEIEASKCRIMFIQLEKKIRDRTEVFIDGVKIQQVTNMSVLGVNFTNTLRLHNRAISENRKLAENTYLLQRISTIGLIDSSEQWALVISSLLKSILYINNFPILALDVTSRNKVERELVKAIKFIFAWSPFSSNKMVKLIFKQPSVKTEIIKLIYKNKYGEFASSYKLVDQIIQSNINIHNRNEFNADHFDLTEYNNHQLTHRRVGNPNKLVTIRQIKSLKSDSLKETTIHEFWYTYAKYRHTIKALMSVDSRDDRIKVKHVERIERNDYKVNYFTQMSALYRVCEHDQGCKKLLINSNNGLYQALINHSNTNYRVIELREKLYDKGFTIDIISNEVIEKRIRSRLEVNRLSSGCTIITNVPDVSDYVSINEERKFIQALEKSDLNNNINSFCAQLSNKLSSWQNINPVEITNRIMNMLSGNVTIKGKLIHHNVANYNCNCAVKSTNNVVLHKSMECDKNKNYYSKANERIKLIINNYNDANDKITVIETLLTDNEHRTSLLNILQNNSSLDQY